MTVIVVRVIEAHGIVKGTILESFRAMRSDIPSASDSDIDFLICLAALLLIVIILLSTRFGCDPIT